MLLFSFTIKPHPPQPQTISRPKQTTPTSFMTDKHSIYIFSAETTPTTTSFLMTSCSPWTTTVLCRTPGNSREVRDLGDWIGGRGRHNTSTLACSQMDRESLAHCGEGGPLFTYAINLVSWRDVPSVTNLKRKPTSLQSADTIAHSGQFQSLNNSGSTV